MKYKSYKVSEIIEIIEEFNSGSKKLELSKKYNIPRGTISYWIDNKEKIFNDECGKEITKNAKRCEICEKIKQRKVKDRPSKEELILMIKESSLEAVGRKYNVSGNAVKKWLKMAV